MTNQHPITPSPDLVQQWISEWGVPYKPNDFYQHLCTQAARWGSDQELEACCTELHVRGAAMQMIEFLRAARRSKPPSLKEQALTALSHLLSGSAQTLDTTEAEFYIRRALEALPND